MIPNVETTTTTDDLAPLEDYDHFFDSYLLWNELYYISMDTAITFIHSTIILIYVFFLFLLIFSHWLFFAMLLWFKIRENCGIYARRFSFPNIY
jgi:hypothetical protein